MNKIVCPNCKAAFDMDEAGFADILKQVRDEEFSRELTEREQRFGVATWRPGEGAVELRGRADAALYAAKGAGRNCVASAPHEELFAA
jgi:PleD family two-component response regulator